MSWGNNGDRNTTLFAQSIISCIIANLPQHNERWFSLTIHHLGISEHVLRCYLGHGDSVLLANLIHFTRQFVRNFFKDNWQSFPLLEILSLLRSNCNVQDTLPSLQHDFCSLWNEVVLQMRDSNHHHFLHILRDFCHIFVPLHQGTIHDFSTHSVSTLNQLCSIPSHRVESASNSNQLQRNSGNTAEAAHATNPAFPSPVLHQHDAVASAVLPFTEYDAGI